MFRGSQFVLSAAFLTMVISLASRAEATVVGAQADGDILAGSTITVFFAQTGPHAALIAAGGPATGVASVPGQFDFSVSGDTFLADWRLTNTTTFDLILRVEFDLTNSASLFDDGTLPDTDFGYAGRAGAVQVNPGAPLIVSSAESNLWPDPMNNGDEYLQEFISYEDFGPGLTSLWRDDTDIIGVQTPPELPEPTSALLLVTSATLCCLGRRR